MSLEEARKKVEYERWRREFISSAEDSFLRHLEYYQYHRGSCESSIESELSSLIIAFDSLAKVVQEMIMSKVPKE